MRVEAFDIIIRYMNTTQYIKFLSTKKKPAPRTNLLSSLRKQTENGSIQSDFINIVLPSVSNYLQQAVRTNTEPIDVMHNY